MSITLLLYVPHTKRDQVNVGECHNHTDLHMYSVLKIIIVIVSKIIWLPGISQHNKYIGWKLETVCPAKNKAQRFFVHDINVNC